MTPLSGIRRSIAPPVRMHQGGWDEILLFFGVPAVLFVILRWLGIRRERREQEAETESPSEDR